MNATPKTTSVLFNLLPAAARSHWVSVAQGERGAGVLAFESGGVIGGAILGFTLFIVGFGLCLVRIGLFHGVQVVLNVTGAALVVAGLTWFVLSVRPRPWQRGTYLFAGTLVVAKGESLTIVPFDRLPPAVLVKASPHLRARVSQVLIGPVTLYDEHRHGFEKHEEYLARYRRAREAWVAARSAGDVQAMRAANPFYDCEVSGNFRAGEHEAGGPHFDNALLSKAGWALTALAALTVGLAETVGRSDADRELDEKISQLRHPAALDRRDTAEQRGAPFIRHARAADVGDFLRGVFEQPNDPPALTLVVPSPDRTGVDRDFPSEALTAAWGDAVSRQVRAPLQTLVDGYATEVPAAARPRLDIVVGERLAFQTPGVKLELRLTRGRFEATPSTPCPLFGLDGRGTLEASGAPPLEFPAISQPMTLDEYRAVAGKALDPAACVAVQLDHHLGAMRKHITWRLFGAL